MNKGKQKCEELRRIRKAVAEQYGLSYDPKECHNEGDCAGTCPQCDAELADLQRQLDERGIRNIDSAGFELEMTDTDNDGDTGMSNEATLSGDIRNPLEEEQGNMAPPDINRLLKLKLQGNMAPPDFNWRKDRHPKRKRMLFKECKVAGLQFRDLDDVWDELYEGAKLALVREKDNEHDPKAVAVACADDYDGDPEDFDFELILGYIPRAENSDIAALLDMGWEHMLECEVTSVSQRKGGELKIAIYFKNRWMQEGLEDEYTLRIMAFKPEDFKPRLEELKENGVLKFRWGGFPPWENDLPDEGEDVVFACQRDDDTILYLMHVIATGDKASYFYESPDDINLVDDCGPFVLTNIKGPVIVQNTDVPFIKEFCDHHWQPDTRLPKEITEKFLQIFNGAGGL